MIKGLNDCECDIGMGLEWSGNETHQEVRVVKVEKFVHEVEDALASYPGHVGGYEAKDAQP